MGTEVQELVHNKNRGTSDFKFATIYCDVDDVVLRSSDAVISILNKRYNITPEKSFNDCEDWGYKTIVPTLTREEVEEIYSSQEFWNTVKFNNDFINLMLSPNAYCYHINFVTKGDAENLQHKEQRISSCMALISSQRGKQFNYTFTGLSSKQTKALIDMSDGIQIDDNTGYLKDTNANIKYLLKNHISTDYNLTPMNEEDFYIINDMHEFQEILDFDYNLKGAFFLGEF